jgi:hypothetical protein
MSIAPNAVETDPHFAQIFERLTHFGLIALSAQSQFLRFLTIHAG